MDEAIALLLPHAQAGAAEVAGTLAQLYLQKAIQGKRPEAIRYADIAPAVDWATRAVEHDKPDGYQVLYTVYVNGLGLDADLDKAFDYLRRGAEGGDTGSKLNYAILLYTGAAQQIPRDVDKACRYFDALFAEPGVRTVTAYYLGRILIQGECGKAVDEAAGAKLIRVAAEAGVRDAEAYQGYLYEQGVGLKQNSSAALKWYARAAEHGESYALWRIGMAYVKGEGRKPDARRAVDYFERSADAGDVRGMNSLAVMYATGDGVQQSFDMALKWYDAAAEAGYQHAMRALGVMYLRGEGVGQDPVRAAALLLRAADMGSAEAGPWLGQLKQQLSESELAQARQEAAEYATGKKPARWQ